MSFTPPPPQSAPSPTRILLLSDFNPELKTRDVQLAFQEWEDDRGGFKIKWVDDVSCWIVFAEASTAKRAYLTTLSTPPPSLTPTSTHVPKLVPYTGSDTPSIFSAVQSRPRARSGSMSQQGGGHSRRSSALGSGGGAALGGTGLNGTNGIGGGSGGPAAGGHQRYSSLSREGRTSVGGRTSFGQNAMRDAMNGGSGGGENGVGTDGNQSTSPPPPAPTTSSSPPPTSSTSPPSTTSTAERCESEDSTSTPLKTSTSNPNLGRRSSLQHSSSHGRVDSLASLTIDE